MHQPARAQLVQKTVEDAFPGAVVHEISLKP